MVRKGNVRLRYQTWWVSAPRYPSCHQSHGGAIVDSPIVQKGQMGVNTNLTAERSFDPDEKRLNSNTVIRSTLLGLPCQYSLLSFMVVD